MTKANFHKLPVDIWCDDNDLMPERATKGSSGWDLKAAEETVVGPNETVLIRTGITIKMPWGWEAQIRSRSGLSKLGITVANSPGTIDNDYTGEICVLIRNSVNWESDSVDKDSLKRSSQVYRIKKGDRIAQMTFNEVPAVEFIRRLSMGPAATERNAKGFGSTGV